MMYLRFDHKVERIRKCQRCGGTGSYFMDEGAVEFRDVDGNYKPFRLGYSLKCGGCAGLGMIVDYPWTRGRSLPPLHRRSAA